MALAGSPHSLLGETLAFALIGDVPYETTAGAPSYVRMIDAINTSYKKVKFTIHAGDIKPGNTLCSDSVYSSNVDYFNRFADASIFLPGDNEWTDCRGAHMGSMDPLERLARLREVFFSDDQSLGRNRIALEVQDHCADAACRCPAYRENRRWSRSGVVFVTLDIPGSENNVGFDAASDAEAKCRGEANMAWLDAAVDLAAAAGNRALVVAIQADIWNNKRHGYDAILAKLPACARRLGARPLLLVHGDTHSLTIDRPFRDATGHAIANLLRLETYGSPFVGWVEVTVDPANPDLFAFAPRLEAVVLP